jgi:multidrug efflux pump subunit AcrA (membrane-fusion protein)
VDIPRDPRPAKRKRVIIGTLVVVGLGAVTLAVRALPSAVPTVPDATTWKYTVTRGTLVRQIRGPGTLVPEQARLITAVTAGRIEQILLLPGSPVKPGEVIMRLSNPDEDMQLLQAQQQLSQAEAQLAQLIANVKTQELTQAQTVAQVRTQVLEANRQYETNRRLFETNRDLVAQSDLDRSREQAEDLKTRLQLEEQRAEVLEASQAEQVSAQQTQIQRLREIVDFRQNRLASLDLTSNVEGVLSPLDLPLQEGQWITAGQQLARVVVPGRLKAEIRIAQTQAQEIVVGQTALIDTRTDSIYGQVVRIDPAVRGGTVTIDVALPTELPASARPDLSVDGNVIIESIPDALYIGRPSFGQANQRVMMFKVVEGGAYAERVPVEFGAASVSEIEVRSGLDPGDVVILSDMSQWDAFDRVRLR